MRLWSALDGGVLWLRADEVRSRRGPDWYENLLADPRCRVILGDITFEAELLPSADPDAELRHLVDLWRAKYGADWVQDWYIEKGRVPVKLRLVGP